MTKKLRLLLALTLFGFQAPATIATVEARQAQQRPQTQQIPQGQQAQRIATPALWVLRDADTEIYIFGTSHLLPQGVNWLHGPVRQAFDAADTLVLEMVQPDDPAALQPIIVRLGLNPGGATLSSRLPEPLRGRLAETTRKMGLPMAAVDSMRPWLAATTIAVSGLRAIGMDPAHGVEAVLKQHAAQRGMRISGLETPEQQFGFLANLPEDDQIALLKASIEELDHVRQESSKMLNNWMTGDIEAVGTMMNESLRESPRLAKALLADRNGNWAVWVSNRMKQPGRVFLAVGAGHLAGPDNLFDLLAKQGFKVKRIPTGGAPAPAR